LAAPLGYLAVESGWIVRCVGRQPWIVYGELRTVDMASHLPASEVLASLSGFVILYSFLLISALYFGSKIIRKGPDLDLPLPPSIELSMLEPVKHQPDQRPIKSQS
jgi:cytochrome d ubiquinol oxidase subunit I